MYRESRSGGEARGVRARHSFERFEVTAQRAGPVARAVRSLLDSANQRAAEAFGVRHGDAGVKLETLRQRGEEAAQQARKLGRRNEQRVPVMGGARDLLGTCNKLRLCGAL